MVSIIIYYRPPISFGSNTQERALDPDHSALGGGGGGWGVGDEDEGQNTTLYTTLLFMLADSEMTIGKQAARLGSL